MQCLINRLLQIKTTPADFFLSFKTLTVTNYLSIFRIRKYLLNGKILTFCSSGFTLAQATKPQLVLDF